MGVMTVKSIPTKGHNGKVVSVSSPSSSPSHRTARQQQQQKRLCSTGYLLLFFVLLNLFGFFMIYFAAFHQPFLLSPPTWLMEQSSFAQYGGSVSIKNKNATTATTSSTTSSIIREKGREESLRRLRELGIDMDDLDEETIQQLPLWEDVVSQYGDKAIVLGLDTCDKYRNEVAPRLKQRLLAAAGTFNSGTNLLAFTLENNCQLSDGQQLYGGCRYFRRGINWQVPWGKHNPMEARLHNTIKKALYKAIPQEIVLPVVTIRHPFDWLQSMCKHRYTMKYAHQVRGKHCPYIVSHRNETVPVRIDYGYPGRMHYETVIHLWNRWYRAYYETIQFPRLMVRHEDLVFYPDQVVQQVCQCVGGTYLVESNSNDNTTNFQAELTSAKTGKGHGNARTGFIDAWIKYGRRREYKDFHPIDRAFAKDILDKELLEVFQYEV